MSPTSKFLTGLRHLEYFRRLVRYSVCHLFQKCRTSASHIGANDAKSRLVDKRDRDLGSLQWGVQSGNAQVREPPIPRH